MPEDPKPNNWYRMADRQDRNPVQKLLPKTYPTTDPRILQIQKAVDVAIPFLENPQLAGTRIQGEFWDRSSAIGMLRTIRHITAHWEYQTVPQPQTPVPTATTTTATTTAAEPNPLKSHGSPTTSAPPTTQPK